MKLDFNCTICIDKSGKTFFILFLISSISIPPNGISYICILNRFRGEENQTFFGYFFLELLFYICYISLSNLRNTSREAFDNSKQQPKSVLRKIPI